MLPDFLNMIFIQNNFGYKQHNSHQFTFVSFWKTIVSPDVFVKIAHNIGIDRHMKMDNTLFVWFGDSGKTAGKNRNVRSRPSDSPIAVCLLPPSVLLAWLNIVNIGRRPAGTERQADQQTTAEH